MCTLSLNSIPQFKDIACCPSWSKTNWEERGQPKRACAATPVLDLILHTTTYTTSQNQLPYCGAYQSVWSEDMHRRSIWIPKTHVTKQNCLNLSNALLIPCASLSMVSCTINFVFKVLFIFPSRYLFASGLVPIFSFRSLSPVLGCIPKQPDSGSATWLVHNVQHTGFSPSTMCRSKQLKHSASIQFQGTSRS